MRAHPLSPRRTASPRSHTIFSLASTSPQRLDRPPRLDVPRPPVLGLPHPSQWRFPNDGQKFVAWYLRNILFRDMNETRDDITDGRDDKQIDAIVIDDEKLADHSGQIHTGHPRCRVLACGFKSFFDQMR